MKINIISMLLFISTYSYSQINLVPNPSFEIHDSCPYYVDQLNFATGWIKYFTSPDYFHKCSTNYKVSIPQNCRGFQETVEPSDSAYCGIGIEILGNVIREHIGCYLSDTLKIGIRYYFSFLFSPWYIDTPGVNYTHCFSSNLGLKLFTYDINSVFPPNYLIDNTPIVYDSSIDIDTSSWKTFKSSFIADSQYTFLMIGNFFEAGHFNYYCIDTIPITNYRWSGFYLDRICLSTDSNTCCKNIITNNPINHNLVNIGNNYFIKTLFINIDSSLLNNELKIYSSTGQLIYNSKITSSISIQYSNWAKGIYIVNIANYNTKIIIL